MRKVKINAMLLLGGGAVVLAVTLANLYLIMIPLRKIPIFYSHIYGILVLLWAVSLVFLFTKMKKKTFFTILFLASIMSVDNSFSKSACVPGDCNCEFCDCFSAPANPSCTGRECNQCKPIEGRYEYTLLYGDESKSANRRNIFFIGEGWTANQQEIFNEEVEAMIKELRKNKVYSSYFDFFNFWRINIVSPENGIDVLSNIDNKPWPEHYLLVDDEDSSLFTSEGNWFFVESSNAFNGKGYHLALVDSSSLPPIARWRFVVPTFLGTSNLNLAIYPSWVGSGAGVKVKYTLRKNGTIIDTIYGNQWVGKGRFIDKSINPPFFVDAEVGDILEITVEPSFYREGIIVADSLFVYNRNENTGVTFERHTYFNGAVYYEKNDLYPYPKIYTDSTRVEEFLGNTFHNNNSKRVPFVPNKDIYVIMPMVDLKLGGAGRWDILMPIYSPALFPLIWGAGITLAHELGHAMGKLFDENHGHGCCDLNCSVLGTCGGYEQWCFNNRGQEPSLPNLTYYKTVDMYGLKWQHLIDAGILPADTLYYACEGSNNTIYQPSQYCLMGSFPKGSYPQFDPLCEEQVIRQFYDDSYGGVDIIDDVYPDHRDTIFVYDNQTLFFAVDRVNTHDVVGLGDSILSEWYLDDNLFASGNDIVFISADNLNSGSHILTLRVDDHNPALVEKHPYCYGWPHKNPNCTRDPNTGNPLPYRVGINLLPEVVEWSIEKVDGLPPEGGIEIRETTEFLEPVATPGEIAVQTTVTAQAGVAEVILIYQPPSGSYQFFPMKETELSNVYEYVLDVPLYTVGTGHYFIQAISNDGQVAQDMKVFPDMPYSITFAIYDNTSPAIHFVSEHPDTGNTSSAIVITGVEDDYAVQGVNLMVSKNGLPFLAIPMVFNPTTGWYEGDAGVVGFPWHAETSIQYYVVAEDIHGNSSAYFSSEGIPFSFTVDNLGPTVSNTTQVVDTFDVNGPYFIMTTVSNSSSEEIQVTLTYTYECGDTTQEYWRELTHYERYGNNFEFQIPGSGFTTKICYFVSASDVWGNSNKEPAVGYYSFTVTDNIPPVCYNATRLNNTSVEKQYTIAITCMDNSYWGNNLGMTLYVNVDGGEYKEREPTSLIQDPYGSGMFYATFNLCNEICTAPRTFCYHISAWDTSENYTRVPLAGDYCFKVVYPFTPGTLFAVGMTLSGGGEIIYKLNTDTGKLESFVNTLGILAQSPGIYVDEEGFAYANGPYLGALAYDPIGNYLYFTYIYQVTYPYEPGFRDAVGRVDAAGNLEFVFGSSEYHFAGYSQDIVFTNGYLVGTMDEGKLWQYDPNTGEIHIISDAIRIGGWWRPLTVMNTGQNDVLYAPLDSSSTTMLKIWEEAGSVATAEINIGVEAWRVRELASDSLNGYVYLYVIEESGSRILRLDTISGLVEEFAPLGFPNQGTGPAMEVDPLTGKVVLQQGLRMIDPTASGGWSLFYVYEGNTAEDLLNNRVTTSTIGGGMTDLVFAFVQVQPSELEGIIREIATDVTQTDLPVGVKMLWRSFLRRAVEDVRNGYYCSARDLLEAFMVEVSGYSGAELRTEEKEHFLKWTSAVIAVLNRVCE